MWWHPIRRRRPVRRGLIYFVEGELTGLIKIGFTDQLPTLRLAQLQTGSPDRLKLRGVMWGRLGWEQMLHISFAEARSHNEWFRPVPELQRYISSHTTTYELLALAGIKGVLDREPGLTPPKEVEAHGA